jgi:hypothetical protein
MTTLKTVMIAAALIAGGTSLAMAQAQGSSGPDGQLKDGAADNPPARSPASGRTARHHGTTHHRMYYMQSGSTAANAAASGGSGTHRGALKTGSAASNQKVLHNQSGYR